MVSTFDDRVDGISATLAIKAPCAYATTGNITLAGLGVQGGGEWVSTLADNTRILVCANSDTTTNGIYNASSSGWNRAKDFDGARDAANGTLIIVAQQRFFQVTTADPVIFNSSHITFTEISVVNATANLKLDGSDESSTMQLLITAAAAAKTPLLLPTGTVRAAGLIYPSNTIIIGNTQVGSIIKAPNGANTEVLKATNADSLWGTNTNGGSTRCIFRGFTVDGNKANNTAGSGLAHYGIDPIMDQMDFTNCAEWGLRTESGSGTVSDGYSREGHFSNIRVDNTGKDGWRFSGPGDSHIKDVIIVDASQATTNTYDSFLIDGHGNARIWGMHCYTRSTSHHHRYGYNNSSSVGGSQLCASYMEGTESANWYFNAPNDTADSACVSIAPRGGVNVIITGNAGGTKYFGGLGGTRSADISLGYPEAVGIQLGTAASSVTDCIVDCVSSSTNAGVVDFTYSGARNLVRVNAFFGSAGTLYVGTPSSTDQVNIVSNVRGSLTLPTGRTHGTVRLIRNNNTSISLIPYGGGTLLVNGGLINPVGGWQMYAIDIINNVALSAGAASPATVNTLYYIYGYQDTAHYYGVILEASTTGYTLDSGGIALKTGDSTRTLVGMAWCIDNGVGVPIWQDAAAKRYVASYFNRKPTLATTAFTADRTVTGTSFAEINAETEAGFMSWGDAIVASYAGSCSNAAAGDTCSTALTIDGVSTILGGTINLSVANGDPENCSVSGAYAPSEGRHYVTLAGKVNASTGTWYKTNPASNLSVVTNI